jgi:CrcB protein
VTATLLAIGIGGALGALARYGVDETLPRRVGETFPWSTLAINVSGSFVLGLLFVLLVESSAGPPWLRAALTTGFISTFTTFATFSVQIVQLAEQGHPGVAISYVLASVVLCVFASAAAILAARISPWFGWVGGGAVTAVIALAFVRTR